MLKIKYSKIITLGSGPSSYTFSLYILRSNFNIIIISGPKIGGQLTKTGFVENWPSIQNIRGVLLMDLFYKQILKYNVEIYNDNIYYSNLLNKPFIIFGRNSFYICEFLNISTGSSHKIFKLKNQLKFVGKNISNCATCDGNFYNRKTIGIIGGGDSCFENLIILIKISKNLILVNRNKKFKASLILIKKIFFNFEKKFFLKLNFFVLEFIGDDFFLIYLKIKNFFNLKINILFINALFIFIGGSANSFYFLGQLKIFNNFILTKKKFSYNFSLTSINFIFSAGDVQDFLYKQAISGASGGCAAYFDFVCYYKKKFL